MYSFKLISHNLWCTPGNRIGTTPFQFIIKWSTTCILFADDTTSYVSDNNITELYKLVNQDTASLAEWFNVNKLTLNISKTHHVLFSKTKNVKSDTHVLKLDNTIINRVKCVNFMGL